MRPCHAARDCDHVFCDGRELPLGTNEAVTVTSKFAGENAGLHVLPIDLDLGSSPALIFTLKNRTLNPVAERFLACAREVAKSMSNRRNRRTQS